jgi:hypothetical protein
MGFGMLWSIRDGRTGSDGAIGPGPGPGLGPGLAGASGLDLMLADLLELDLPILVEFEGDAWIGAVLGTCTVFARFMG